MAASKKPSILVASHFADLAGRYSDRFEVIEQTFDRPASGFELPGEHRNIIAVAPFFTVRPYENNHVPFLDFLESLLAFDYKQIHIILDCEMSFARAFIDYRQTAMIDNLKIVYTNDSAACLLYAIGLIDKAARFGVYG